MSSSLYPLLPPFVAVVILLARLLMDFGYKLGLVDQPNERSSHSNVVPRVGGLAIFVPYLILGVGFYVFGYDYAQLNTGYWLGLTAIVVLGTIDDRMDLSSSIKFLVQFAVAAYYVFSTGNYVDSMHGLFGIGLLPSWLGISLSIITIVYLINAVNLIDGVDGLAAGIGLLALYLFSSLMGGGEQLITFAFVGIGLIIFMGFNYSKKRKIFLGDSGSLGLGFILATFAMEFLHTGYNHSANLNLNPVIVAILVLGYPVADTFRVFAIRISLGLSPFNADRRHLHHILFR
jgi:UDP-N-acetylmuramyl pentapeptide phosphotransferase/UDP-N-acetylglucosamine-1-phosphate transferase